MILQVYAKVAIGAIGAICLVCYRCYKYYRYYYVGDTPPPPCNNYYQPSEVEVGDLSALGDARLTNK